MSQADAWSLEDLSAIVADMLGRVDALESQSSNLTNGQQVYSGSLAGQGLSTYSNVVTLDTPYLAVSGTTTAYASVQTTSVASAVPANATTLFLTCEVKFGHDNQSMVISVYTPNGTSLPLYTSYTMNDDIWHQGSVVVKCSGQNLKWSITNQSGGTTTTGWVSYKIWVTGYAT